MRRRVSSNDGMFRTGDTGIVGLRIDLRGNEAVDFSENQISLVGLLYAGNLGRQLPCDGCRLNAAAHLILQVLSSYFGTSCP